MKEYDIKITEVLEKTVQVQAESREEAEAIASENWNNSMYDMDSAEDYLEDLQEAVGGYIQCVYPYEEPVGIICNEEGKLNGAVLNRALYGEDGGLQDIIAGDFLVVGLTEESFGSLTDEQMKRFEAKFHQPETFVKMGKSIMVLPIPEDQVKRTMAKRMSREGPGREESPKGDHKVIRFPAGHEM